MKYRLPCEFLEQEYKIIYCSRIAMETPFSLSSFMLGINYSKDPRFHKMMHTYMPCLYLFYEIKYPIFQIRRKLECQTHLTLQDGNIHYHFVTDRPF